MTSTAIGMGVGQRIAAWLRQAYPDAKAKRIALDFGCDERTAKSWLAGERPIGRHLDAMIARWGRVFFAFVYEPVLNWAEQERLDAELAALQSVTARLRSVQVTTPVTAPARTSPSSAPPNKASALSRRSPRRAGVKPARRISA